MRNGKPLVIFAEDYADTLAFELIEAKSRGWDAVGATNVTELLDAFNNVCMSGSCWVDCIVADIQFHHDGNGPRRTGIGAISRIRQQFPHVSVLYYSGFINGVNRDLIEKQGLDYLEKPATIQDLFGRIEALIQWSFMNNYTGPERRNTSINRQGHTRRCTDRPVTLPDIVEELILVARAAEAGETTQ